MCSHLREFSCDYRGVGETMDSDLLRVGRERLSRVFRFMETLNQHRNPPKLQIREQPWTLWLLGLRTRVKASGSVSQVWQAGTPFHDENACWFELAFTD
jgi:hypothetical protein